MDNADIVNLIACDAIGWMPGCSSGDLRRRKSIHQGHFIHECECQKSFSSFIGFSHPKASYTAVPVHCLLTPGLSIPVSFYNEEVFPWNLLDGASEQFVKPYHYEIFLISWRRYIYLYGCDIFKRTANAIRLMLSSLSASSATITKWFF